MVVEGNEKAIGPHSGYDVTGTVAEAGGNREHIMQKAL